ncbi:MAG: hypothetical protein QXM06_03790 [Archaeoglobaceae archaeon]
MDTENELRALFDILTELERLNCFEIKTSENERWKIVKEILKIIENDLEEELLEKMSGRWL